VVVDDVTIRLAQPIDLRQEWIGNRETLQQLLACWLVVDARDLPLSPRVTGPPGIGKTTLAMSGARERKQDLYIYQCTADTRPEDLLITPVLAESGTIAYQASPLVTAMLTGSVCVLDEGNRMNEKSWASLAPLLDHRRCIESVVAGILVTAHPQFRCCVTMNEDASVYEVPDYILSRLQPTLNMGFPSREDELAILRYHVPFAPAELLAVTADFLQNAHQLNLAFSVRDGIHILQYALKRLAQDPTHPLAKEEVWREALIKVLGEEALDLEGLSRRRKRAIGDQPLPQGLGDFFFEGDDPLHPDR
jgi:MoxR-like ATPase